MKLPAPLHQIFKRKPDRFIKRLREQSALVLRGTDALKQYVREPNKKNAARVRLYEKKADDIRRELILELNHTFVTPIDREDLFSLSRSIDDILDYAYATIYEIDVLDVIPNAYLQHMVDLLHVGAKEIYLAIHRLEQQPQAATKHVMRAKSLENRMESLYARAIADLFNDPEDLNDVVSMMKMREIYRQLFHAVQSTDQAADNIGDIIVKFY